MYFEESQVYIAGVGYTPSPAGARPKAVVASIVSAATKALLDAGITFEDVTRGVRGERKRAVAFNSRSAFDAFAKGAVPVDEVEHGFELESAFHWIRDRGAHCVMAVAVEESSAVALVLVSEDFLASHAYLNDSAALVSEPEDLPFMSYRQPVLAREPLRDICNKVWALRGWLPLEKKGSSIDRLMHARELGQSFELSRADAQPVPDWEQVQHKLDGKHRLGYNPALKTRDIAPEDFDSVRVGSSSSSREHEAADKYAQFGRTGGDRAALVMARI